MLLEVRLMQSRRGEREFATPKFYLYLMVCGPWGLRLGGGVFFPSNPQLRA